MTGRGCGTCGSFGHRAGPRCPYNEAIKRQDPHRLDPPRPEAAAPSDPSLRDAPRGTMFLMRSKRLV